MHVTYLTEKRVNSRLKGYAKHLLKGRKEEELCRVPLNLITGLSEI